MPFHSSSERLAVDGGPRALCGDPPPWPRPDEAVREALERAWADGSWGRYHAEHTDRLAAELARLHAVEFVTLCPSGTFAVELALRALKVGEGDEVILAGYDFPGNFRAIEATGARPVLVDLAPGSWRLDPHEIPPAIGPRTKALIVSHLHGELVDMASVCDVVRGGAVCGRRRLSGPWGKDCWAVRGSWGHVGVLSFGGSKLITAGRGGAILTSDAELHQRAKVFCQRGNDAFPLSQLQAAVLLPQLSRLEEHNQRRRRAVARLLAQTAQLPGLRPLATSTEDAVFYKLPWHYVASELGERSRDEFVHALQAEGVQTGSGFRGFVRRTARRCRKVGELPHSQRAVNTTLLLHHPILLESDERLDALAAALAKVARAFSRRPSVKE